MTAKHQQDSNISPIFEIVMIFPSLSCGQRRAGQCFAYLQDQAIRLTNHHHDHL